MTFRCSNGHRSPESDWVKVVVGGRRSCGFGWGCGCGHPNQIDCQSCGWLQVKCPICSPRTGRQRYWNVSRIPPEMRAGDIWGLASFFTFSRENVLNKFAPNHLVKCLHPHLPKKVQCRNTLLLICYLWWRTTCHNICFFLENWSLFQNSEEFCSQ